MESPADVSPAVSRTLWDFLLTSTPLLMGLTEGASETDANRQ
ncbi:MAG TPA: hypothetical protein VN282_24235 [Pyrinomonadaceae bacterium]|nr:hypothetical protein [Pyrinomonadaceae bacterium]